MLYAIMGLASILIIIGCVKVLQISNRHQREYELEKANRQIALAQWDAKQYNKHTQ